MALSCDLASLTAASRCFNCLSSTEKQALKVHFMAQTLKAAGGPDLTNLNVRNQASACLACEPDFMLDSMETATWQNLAVNMGSIIPTSISELRKLIRCTPCGEQKTTRAAFISLLCRLIGISPPVRETDAWAVRVLANGGPSPSQNTLTAVNNFLSAIASLRSRIYHLNIIAPDSIIAMRTPLIKDIGFSFWVRHQTGTGVDEQLSASGWYADVNGAGNGVLYDTGVDGTQIPSFNLGNGGMSIYCSEVNAPTVSAALGAVKSVPQSTFEITIARSGDGKNNFICCDVANLILVLARTGFWSGSRTSQNLMTLYSGRTLGGFVTEGTSVVQNNVVYPNLTLAFGGQNLNNSFNGPPITHELSFMAVHDGFNATDTQIFFNAVQALRVALGGGFV